MSSHLATSQIRSEKRTTDVLEGPHFGRTGDPSLGRVAEPPPDRASQPAAAELLATRDLHKRYRRGTSAVEVLRGVDLQVMTGEFLAVVGQSGSGKSTLLHLLGTLDRPDRGEIWFRRQRIDQLPARSCERLRNASLGLVFQFYHLLPELTALENVQLAGMIEGGIWGYWRRRRALRSAAREILGEVGLQHRLGHRPCELSGGEMQRVAIARALITRPQVLLADEPTGNLDRRTGAEIFDILRRLNAQQKLTIVMVTHDETLAGQADRAVRLVEGRVQDAEPEAGSSTGGR